MTQQNTWLENLSLLIKPAGPDCNLNCAYCFYTPKLFLYPEQAQHQMPVEVMRNVIRQYLEMTGSTPSFGWQGGEPTLMGLDFFRRIVAVQAQSARANTAIANGFQTNGILINNEWARFLRRYNFLVGLSLDGPAHIHDFYRVDKGAQPTFKRVMRAVETLRNNEVEFNILCMVTNNSAGHADEILDFFLAHNLRYMQFIPCLELDNETGKIAPYSCTPEQFGEFMLQVHERWSATTPPAFYVRMLDDIYMQKQGYPAPSCIFRPQCGDYLLIEHNGDVYPCDFFVEPQWLLGNVMQTPLREIALSDKFRQFRQGKSNYGCQPADSSTKEVGCYSCEWLNFCHGGCQRHRLMSFGETWERNYFCEAYKGIFNCICV